MRLAPLLAQYLYVHKRLDLPGLGVFHMEAASYEEQESGRYPKTSANEKISFEPSPSVKESPELIAFISAQTGKIKALASADLESHLELAHQFLNIGKPFTLEGIGTVVKESTGEFIFTPGSHIAELKKEQQTKEHSSDILPEENVADYNYKSIFYPKPVKSKWKKPVAIFLLVAGLAFAIWGGYTVYKRTTAKKDKPVVTQTEEPLVTTDTTTKMPVDTTTIVKTNTPTVVPAGNYKFVLENTNAERAFPRFSKLKTYQWKVQMETSDSVTYRIFMLLPSTASDTARLRDSLSTLTGRRVYIE